MFGTRKTIEKLEREVSELRGEVSRLATELTRVRPLLADAQQVERSLADLERLRLAARAACDEMNSHVDAVQLHQARHTVPLNSVRFAKVTGYVALYFDGGRTDVVRLLVGPDDPPENCVCEANSSYKINSYAGGIVRAGEYWKAESKVGATGTGFICVFTPLY
jgi:septal ring factor EnvC (AmiA/AmiB activator)